jgi:hypothetical protein
VSSRSSERTRDEGGETRESERRLGRVSGFRDRVRVMQLKVYIHQNQTIENNLRFELMKFTNLFRSNCTEFEFDSKLIRIGSIRFELISI